MALKETDNGLGRMLQDSRLKETLQRLRRTDNVVNVLYLLRAYVYLAAVIGGTVWFYHDHAAAGLAFWWNVPVTALAVILVGAGQHQLAGLAHESAHHTLLRHHLLNDLVSDWLCMFPLFSSTHHYRLQHLAHHQFVNDPLRDPDVSQLHTSGHWLKFPLPRSKVLRTLLGQLRPLGLLRYIVIRSRYNAMPSPHNPYQRKDALTSKIPVRVGIAYLLGMIALLAGLVWHGDLRLLIALPATVWAVAMAFYLLIPERMYHQSRIHPVISGRWMTIGRLTYLTILFGGLALLTAMVDRWAALYYVLLWIVPLGTSFSFFMILRQIVQHGNGGRGWLTNTRVFFVQRFIRFSVFPVGQDYHLPHHLFATVPHYRLKALHDALLAYPEYREQAVVVRGYFLPPPPTVLDVLGPDYAPANATQAHIDNSVLEGEQVEERAAILREAEASAG